MRRSILTQSLLTLCILAVFFAAGALAQTGAVPGTVAPEDRLNAVDEGQSRAGEGLNVFYNFTGKISVSVDGAGSNDAFHTADVNKPSAQAIVRRAFVMAATVYGGGTIADGAITLNGTPISWLQAEYSGPYYNVLADVTDIVQPVMDAAAVGRTSFTFTEANTYSVDGEILVVVFDDPAQKVKKTISLLFGGLQSSGDQFSLTLTKAIDPSKPGMVADMGLGISYSYQGYSCSQYSVVNVNGKLLTSGAGDYDDGGAYNGGLITVGGLDDSNANPADPAANCGDDELYSLLPFIKKTDKVITVNTINPSNDDNILFAYFFLTGEVEVNDRDGDGLPDDWEENGYDADDDGIIDIDLPGMGADPDHKDIFVEVDWMTGRKPTDQAIADVVTAYRKAPVTNPDGKPGINLHVDTGNLGGGNDVGFQDDLGNPPWAAFDAIKDASGNFNEKRSAVFHYCLFANGILGDSTSGISRGIPASDFIVALGKWPTPGGTQKQQTGTFMHELGHNMGLKHGGNDHVNYKPNFLSIMNYFFQMDWLRYKGLDQRLDYSRFNIKPLNETKLNEKNGLDAVGGDGPIQQFGTRWYKSTGAPQVTNKAYQKVDWNCNGKATETKAQADINFDGSLGILTGNCQEWPNIDFLGGSIGSGVATRALLEEPVMRELTFEEYQQMIENTVISK